ncbi:hypothetical protein SAMN05444172_7998 [Burkholderia sp. GAS332]|nr:hypothetical protein SAMN05444172_7998 [Burkholderia sp. GAS332]
MTVFAFAALLSVLLWRWLLADILRRCDVERKSSTVKCGTARKR